jgi:hypothetical protein
MSIDTFLLSADTTDLNYPEVRPTLDLNFARVKALDPRITFTRASGGSYVGADGLIKYSGVNEARFDHDPVTGDSLGLLIEEQRTNLLLRSEEFDTASWSVASTSVAITANTQVAPNGTTTADTLSNSSNTLNEYRLVQFISTSFQVAFSVYIKQGTHSFVQFRTNSDSSGFVNFDLSSIASSATTASGQISDVGNGWRRCTAVFAATAINSVQIQFVSSLSAARSESWAPTGTISIHVWGAQLEEGSFPTSYIPTEESTRTRAADDASITGKNFSEWYRQDEGTIYTKASSSHGQPITGFIYRFAGLGVDLIDFYRQSDFQPVIAVTFNGVSDYVVGSGPIWIGKLPNQLAVAISSSSSRQASNGNLSNAPDDNDVRMPFLNRVSIGNLGSGGVPLNGSISRLTYYPKRLPNAQLQALTR